MRTTALIPGFASRHALPMTVSLLGTATGAAMGALGAGPTGALAGGTLGGLAGLLAGKVLEDGEARVSARTRALDATIGVSGGDMGASEVASSRLSRPSGASGPGWLLRRDHLRLEQNFTWLRQSVDEELWPDVFKHWMTFEHRLLAHFATEEEDLFPELARTIPDEVRVLVREHAQLRALLRELKLDVASQVVGASAMDGLMDALRAHTAREDEVAYRLADATALPSVAIDVEMSLDR